jgi:DNA-binding XRE family transcriptional regulator
MRIELKKIRIEHKMNQREFANKIGISAMSYSRLERGYNDGTLKVWLKIQKALNIEDENMFKLIKKD